MPTSSSRYSAELTPDPRLRSAVIILALTALSAGPVLLWTLPLERALTIAAAVTWLAGGALSLANVIRSFTRCERLTVAADGSLTIEEASGRKSAAELLSGCVVLAGFASLRYRTAEGRLGLDLFAGSARGDRDWRRLQVIWRHLGAQP